MNVWSYRSVSGHRPPSKLSSDSSFSGVCKVELGFCDMLEVVGLLAGPVYLEPFSWSGGKLVRSCLPDEYVTIPEIGWSELK